MRHLNILIPGVLPHLRANFPYYILFLALLIVYTRKKKKQRYAAAPIACVENSTLQAARERFRTDAGSMLREGYEKYKGRPFYVPSPLGERLMIPGKYVEELKTAPVDEVDFVGTFYEVGCFPACRHWRWLKSNRCLRVNTQPWEVAQPYTLVSQSSS